MLDDLVQIPSAVRGVDVKFVLGDLGSHPNSIRNVHNSYVVEAYLNISHR
jgi:hypothetical protein